LLHFLTESRFFMKIPSLAITDRAQLTASLLVLLGGVCFAAKAVIAKLAYRYGIDAVSLLTLRMLFALPFFIIIFGYANRRARLQQRMRFSPKLMLQVAGLGVLGFYLASLLDFTGLQYISASFERLILFIYPTLVVVLSYFFYKRRINNVQGAALVLTYVGITLAFLENLRQASSENFLLGAGFVFMCALVFAFYLIGGGNIIPKLGTWRFTSLAMIAATLVAVLHHGIILQWKLWHYPPELYALMALMAVVATVMPSLLIAEGLRVIGPSNTSIITSVSPIATIVMAGIFLGERLGWLQWTGTFLVIGGVLLTTLYRSDRIS